MPSDQFLPKPTPEIANAKISEFNRINKDVEETLTDLIKQFPKNNVYEQVLVKAAAINLLYSAWIVGIVTVAKHIVALGIDAALDSGDPAIVGKIARVQFSNKTISEYSFATKYCSWHQPTLYPIWDSRVDACLWEYRDGRRNQDLYNHEQSPFPTFKKRSDLWEYPSFRQIVKEFRHRYGLEPYSFKDTDKFLYQLGNEYFYPEGSPIGGQTEPPILAASV